MAKKYSDKELKDLGQMLVNMHELGYVDKRRTLGFAFIKGISTGFGVFLGGTVLIAILLWVLGFFDEVPLLKDFIDSIEATVDTSSYMR